MTAASPPAATGAAGTLFEAQVGAFYLLTLLVGAQPRGLPNTRLVRIELQRASEGHYLDDVIVHAESPQGTPATLAVQVKRSITFAPGDQIFREVVAQIAKTIRREAFWTSRYELGIAIARTTAKIDGAYQDVLSWARELDSAKVFFDRLQRKGAANDDMRRFVRTFREHLVAEGGPNDDETAWKLLARLQILPFDFNAAGSVSQALAFERAARALHTDDGSQAAGLWGNLTQLALQVAATGGDRTRQRLQEDHQVTSFRLLGQLSFTTARAALSESSRHALGDIEAHVGPVSLMRQDRLDAVRDALSTGRYVEIRGASGVGKSGVLKLLAERIARESQIVMLRAGRIIPRGWAAMRATLGFDGLARDLLADIATDGGVFLFIDGLESFSEIERLTVRDLLLEASHVPGISVIATARPDFGNDDLSWLPAEAIARLKGVRSVVISELSSDEVEELSESAPELRALLADDNPARAIARNLYRLSRLLSQPVTDGPVPRTEVDMMDLWWKTADGQKDDGHRNRSRVLRVLADQTLVRRQPLSTHGQPSAAVDALIRSETLRELSIDSVLFRHDVLREWAGAALIVESPPLVEKLVLAQPALVHLARSLELAARHALERNSDTTAWRSLLESVSQPGAHGSWRRAALLGALRSEAAQANLVKLTGDLLSNEGALLSELIRTTLAVEKTPAAELLKALGIPAQHIPPDHVAPVLGVWAPLLMWCLSVGDNLPSRSVPDVAEMMFQWCGGLLALDSLAPLLLQRVYSWLLRVERRKKYWRAREEEPLLIALEGHQVDELELTLRSTFLIFSRRVPPLAAEYLNAHATSGVRDWVATEILKNPGTLAQAVPKELADFTAQALLANDELSEHVERRSERPFGWIDHQFVPASPSQGPFLGLLNASPQHGLSLIRRLVDHAIAYYSRGAGYGHDAFQIPSGSGLRDFPWIRSYYWSRESEAPACVTSALMALEAWAHARLDKGEAPEDVVKDVIEDFGDTPAAYVLIVIDLILSHWPATRSVAVPFLSCPELLCIDRQRMATDNQSFPDIFGLRALQREPPGPVTKEALQRRPSRRLALEVVLENYALVGGPLLVLLRQNLQDAATRLGAPRPEDNFGSPAFMAQHALNATNPANFRKVMGPNGEMEGYQYVAPPEEVAHLAETQREAVAAHAEVELELSFAAALDRSEVLPEERIVQGLEWAKRRQQEPLPSDDSERRMLERAMLSVAAIAARDGAPTLLSEYRDWMRGVFRETLNQSDDVGAALRGGLSFNARATAFFGWAQTLRFSSDPISEASFLLEVAALSDPAGAHGFAASVAFLGGIDRNLPRAILRVALAATIRPMHDWESQAQYDQLREEHDSRTKRAIEAEMSWLSGHASEPSWPVFPIEEPSIRRGLRIGSAGGLERDLEPTPPEATEYVSSQAAALWVGAASKLGIELGGWLTEILDRYWEWSFVSNGSRLKQGDEVDHPPGEWNRIYFELLAMYGVGTDRFARATTAICGLPDEPFFDVLPIYLRAVDTIFFATDLLSATAAGEARSQFVERMTISRGWSRLKGDASGSVEVHIGPAIAVLLFNDYLAFGGQLPKCYLRPLGIDKIDPLIPASLALAKGSPCPFVAIATLNVLDVSPRQSHLPVTVDIVSAWLETFPDTTTFWIGHSIGRRVCSVFESILAVEGAAMLIDSALLGRLNSILAALVRLGVSDASALEVTLLGNT